MLSIQNLSKTYRGGKKAVCDLSLEIAAGDIYGFIGPNGAGKTTTIKCCVGISDFESGEIYIDGKSVKTDPLACKSVTAYIPDNPDLYEFLTGGQYLDFVSNIFGLETSVKRERIAKYAGEFEILDVLGNMVSSYSHGMKQKLAIVSALIHTPKLLILDEPFVGLDPKASLTLKGYMHELTESGGAIFFSTHVLDVAERLCGKVAIIRDGKLVASGETASLIGGRTLESVFMEVADDA